MGNIISTNQAHPAGAGFPRVLFLVMPFAAVHAGSLGASTLKAILARNGIQSDIRHFNLSLAKEVGIDAYNLFTQLAGGAYRGEIFFSPFFFDLPMEDFIEREIAQYAQQLYPYIRELHNFARYENEKQLQDACADIVRIIVPEFLSSCMEKVNWGDYDIVGFSVMFDQMLPSLCLARRIKERNPEIKIVFGGAACDGEIGAEMIRSFSCVDVVARGEADETITPLVERLRSGQDLSTCPGIVFRNGDKIIEVEAARPVENLDALPRPDYRDYLAETKGLAAFKPEFGTFTPSLYFESARGCWWGQKHLCSFCGLNLTGLSFRKKSPDRVIEEILALEQELGITSFMAADNIIDLSYLTTMVPKLAEINRQRPEAERLQLFYETKSNLKKSQMRSLKEAGVTALQPGIESFSNHVLELMKKGSTGIQQIQFIKWATELDLRLTYGILHGNPGETQADYEEMADTVRFVRHLAPPVYVTPMLLDRFSPYFNEPGAYGIRNVRAHESYHRIFPSPHINHDRLAFRFSFDHEDKNNPGLAKAVEKCCKLLRQWQREFVPDRLIYTKEDDTIYVLDRRKGEKTLGTLRREQAAIFEYCDEFHTLPAICSKWPHIPAEKISRFLDLLVQREWMYCDAKGRFLSLPILRSSEFLELGLNAAEAVHSRTGELAASAP